MTSGVCATAVENHAHDSSARAAMQRKLKRIMEASFVESMDQSAR